VGLRRPAAPSVTRAMFIEFVTEDAALPKEGDALRKEGDVYRVRLVRMPPSPRRAMFIEFGY
jgi:hypothetical protein